MQNMIRFAGRNRQRARIKRARIAQVRDEK